MARMRPRTRCREDRPPRLERPGSRSATMRNNSCGLPRGWHPVRRGGFTMRNSFILIGSLFALACGGSNPGGGTRTLWVNAAAETDGSTDGSRLQIEVREGSSTGTLVTDATV